MQVQRIAAFSKDAAGGNPAGVVICEELPGEQEMQALAAEVGYSETAFAAPSEDGWRVRYFAPAMEVPFCGHATIALGAALTDAYGGGVFKLQLNDARITVEGEETDSGLFVALQSPPTRSAPASEPLIAAALDLFSLSQDDLDPRLPPAIMEAGARHLLLSLSTRSRLAAMDYDLDAGAELMRSWELTTIALVYAEGLGLFHARNAFAAGGVFEDPATGAAAAALAGYLRDLKWAHGGRIQIAQGEDMGVPSLLYADIPSQPGSSIKVSGAARVI